MKRMGRSATGRKRGLSPFFRAQKGFTYLGVLLTVAATGAVLASAGELASHTSQREKEAELLFIGNEFRNAIGRYYEKSPGGDRRYPKRLEELLEDERHPVVQRYLRRLYRDPLSGKAEWGLVEAPEGGIMGVHSLSEALPIKTGNFARPDEPFAEATRYADWQFIYTPIVSR
jgi:type II secretory pathway pseudopilin PulG